MIGIESIIIGSPLWTYFTIFFSVIIIGNVASFLTFWLAFFGYFGPWGIILTATTILIADIFSDLFFYSLGRYLRNTRFGNFLKNRFSRIKRVRDYVNEDTVKWIFLAKFVSSTNAPFVFLSGWAKVDFKKFFRISIFAILNWLCIILAITYILKTSFSPIASIAIFKSLEILLSIGIILFLIANFIIGRLFKKGIGKIWSEKAAGFVTKKRK